MSNQERTLESLTKDEVNSFQADLHDALIEVANKHNIKALSYGNVDVYQAIEIAVEQEFEKAKEQATI